MRHAKVAQNRLSVFSVHSLFSTLSRAGGGPLLLAALLTLAACGSTPAPIYYTLGETSPASPAKTAGMKIALMPASLPELIDRPQIVTRREDGTVTLSERHRWASSLRDEIPRALAASLASRLSSAQVVARPADIQEFSPDLRLWLDIQQLDVLARETVLDVAWRIVPRDGAAIVGRSTIAEALADSDDIHAAAVAALRRALHRLAAQLAVQMGGD